MATLIPVTKIQPAGIDVQMSPVAVGETYEFLNAENCFIEIQNNGTERAMVRFYTQLSYDELAVEDMTINVNAGQRKVAGPFLRTVFDTASHKVLFTVDNDDQVTVAVLRI